MVSTDIKTYLVELKMTVEKLCPALEAQLWGFEAFIF